MELAAVCSREIGEGDDEQLIEFGTTGYTLNNVFVLYDRKNGTTWYPLKEGGFDAVAGVDQGKVIEFLEKPAMMKLSEWMEGHPETTVLLPPAADVRRMKMMRERGRGGGGGG